MWTSIKKNKKIKQEWIKRPYTTNHSHIFPDSKLWDFNSILKYRDLKRWTTTSFPGRTYIVLLTQEYVYPALCSLTLFQQRGLETREEETRERCWYSNHWVSQSLIKLIYLSCCHHLLLSEDYGCHDVGYLEKEEIGKQFKLLCKSNLTKTRTSLNMKVL